MPRPRSEWSIEAERRYHAGEKLTDIAKAMGKPEGTVRRWKSDQDWDGKKKQTERSETITERSETRIGKNTDTGKLCKNISTSKNPEIAGGKVFVQDAVVGTPETTRHPQARPGNKNAVGNAGGAPPGNKNAVTTGEYETLLYADLSDEERALYDMPIDEIDELEAIIREERVRRHRMKKRVSAAENTPGGMVIDNVVKVQGISSVRLPLGTQTMADAGVNRADRFENSLTRVVNSSRATLGLIHKIKTERAKIESDTKDDVVDDWLGGDDWNDKA